MPTKYEIIGCLIGYGVPHIHEPYLDQLFDRIIRDVRRANKDFGKIEEEGRTFNYSCIQAHYIIDHMRQLTDDALNDQTGWNLTQKGCNSPLLKRVGEHYKELASAT